MIQFQFHDSLVFDFKKHSKKLETKLRESFYSKYVFLTDCGMTRIDQLEIVCYCKSQQVQNLKRVKSFNYNNGYIKNVLFNKQENEFVICSGINVCVMDLCSVKKREIISNDQNLHSIQWYYSKQEEKKFLIIARENGNVTFLNWCKNVPFKTLEIGKHDDFKLVANEKSKELLVSGSFQFIDIWCLKTFTQKKRFYSRGVAFSACFLNGDLIANVDIVGGRGDKSISIWNKKTGQYLCIQENTHDGWSVLRYSEFLNLLVSFGCNEYTKLWKVDTLNKKLELMCVIENPFGSQNRGAEFLDPKTQTQLLHGDFNGNLYIVDLILKKVVWKWEAPKFQLYPGSILIQ